MLAFDFDLDFHFAEHGELAHPTAGHPIGLSSDAARSFDLDLDLDGPH